MVPNPAIRNLIREDKIHQIYGMMQTGQLKYGMQTFNQSLAELTIRGDITQDQAMSYSSNQDELRELINRGAGVPTARAQAAASAAATPGMAGRNPNIKYS